jgi:DNA-binding NtrC family response regulator
MNSAGATQFATIDDEKAWCAIFERHLKSTIEETGFPENFEITSYKSIEDFVVRYEKDDIDPPMLLILDKNLEEMDVSYRHIDQITGIMGGQNIRIVASSSDNSTSACAEAYQAGACDFIAKPIDDLEFMYKVRGQLKQTQKILQEAKQRDVMSQNLAMLMENSDEMVTLIKLMEKTVGSKSVKDLSNAEIEACGEFGLKASMIM